MILLSYRSFSSVLFFSLSVAYICLICEWTISALLDISKSQYGYCGFNQFTLCVCVQLKENHRENQRNCGLDDLTNKFILYSKHPMRNSSLLTIREVKQLFNVLTGNQSTKTEFHLSNTTWVNVRHIISFCFSVSLNCKKQSVFIYFLHILSSWRRLFCFWKKKTRSRLVGFSITQRNRNLQNMFCYSLIWN